MNIAAKTSPREQGTERLLGFRTDCGIAIRVAPKTAPLKYSTKSFTVKLLDLRDGLEFHTFSSQLASNANAVVFLVLCIIVKTLKRLENDYLRTNCHASASQLAVQQQGYQETGKSRSTHHFQG